MQGRMALVTAIALELTGGLNGTWIGRRAALAKQGRSQV